jgi:hypothetical protein
MSLFLKAIGKNNCMFKIPLDFNVKKIINERIIQIAFSLNSVSLFFEKGYIQFSGKFSYEKNGALKEFNEVFPAKNDFGLISLLEKQIQNATTNSERTNLKLEFENGDILLLYGTPEFESYSIKIENSMIRI